MKKAVRLITERREPPKATIIFYIALYLILASFTVISARSDKVITIGEGVLPVATFAGMFSSLSNVYLVVMVLYYKIFGLITAFALLLVQLPVYLTGLFVNHNLASLPGMFSGAFTVIMLVLIHIHQMKMQRAHKKTQHLFEQTATALVNAIDAKDTYTHGHSSRVAEYSRRLAEMNYKSPAECDEIYYTALLHDVGKIGVPSSIINKAGKLTSEEYAIVKAHPVMGAQILDTISDYPYLSIGAHWHHERYDGKGYPDGLKGEEIPEIARIVSVADAYDAMTSIRSYRDPIPQDKVREEIVKGTGTQFDPKYARLMLHLIDVDTEYEMKERAKHSEYDSKNDLIIGAYRSAVSNGILITPFMTTISMSVSSDDEAAGIAPVPSVILYDALDGLVHNDEKGIKDMLYFEYGEIWFDGRTMTGGARKMQSKVEKREAPDIKLNGEYKIEAVRIADHAMIRVIGKKQTVEITVALPDSTRFMYIGLTGVHCRIGSLDTFKSETESPADYIPRIAERISYIAGCPEGIMPNVQIDGFRSAHSEGIEIKDGLTVTFHAKSLPTARLV